VLTLRSAFEIDRLFKDGKRSSSRLLVLLARRREDEVDPRGRVVFVAGRKLGGAVLRNRCKRVMRESCRRAGGPWKDWDVALVARGGIAEATASEIDIEMSECLARIGISAS